MDRPMTHNLLINVIEFLGAQLDSVIISAVSGKTLDLCQYFEGQIVKLSAPSP